MAINGIGFIGATLWTDYHIDGNQLLAMRLARERMNDYSQIPLKRKLGSASLRRMQRGCTRIRGGSSSTP